LIYDRRDTWFQNSLEESDIETAFNSSIRIYKSGKFYLIRTNVKNNHTTNTPSINIYTEQEIPLTMDDVNTETNIISILEIQGIKFTSRNFQIEIELKQMMVLNNEPIFNNCLIKTNKHIENKESKHLEKFDIDLIPSKPDVFNEPIDDLVEHSETNEIIKESEINDIIKESGINEIIKETEINDITKETEINDITKEFETSDENIILDMEDLCEDIEENVDTLKEIGDVSLSLENNLETIKLKKPNQVYFELYREARNKAKMAKKNAILAYLEAKNIKKTYLIENLNDSDSDFDAEIDEVSESELEDFD
jgi:hypothetical protein